MNAFFEVYLSVATLVILLIIVAAFTHGFVFVVSQCARYLRGSFTKRVNSAPHSVRSPRSVGAFGESNLVAGSPEPVVPGSFAGILVHHGGPVRRVEPAYRPDPSRRLVRI